MNWTGILERAFSIRIAFFSIVLGVVVGAIFGNTTVMWIVAGLAWVASVTLNQGQMVKCDAYVGVILGAISLTRA